MKYIKTTSIISFLLLISFFIFQRKNTIEENAIGNKIKIHRVKRKIASVKISQQKKKLKGTRRIKKKNIIKRTNIKEINIAIQRLNKMARYPKTSNPIHSSKTTKIEERYIAKKQIVNTSLEHGYQVKSWLKDNYIYLPFRSQKISIQLLHNRLPTKGIIKASIYDQKDNLIKNLKFKSSPNFIYSTKINNLQKGKYTIKYNVYPLKDPSKKIIISSIESFTVLNQNIVYKNLMKDSLNNDGNLIIEAYIDVKNAGNYLLESICYSDSNKPIALAERLYSLKKGKQWIKFDYHGQIFVHSRQEGKFKIKHLSISKVQKNLSITPGMAIKPNYTTKLYQISQFNTTPYENQELINKKNKLLAYLKGH